MYSEQLFPLLAITMAIEKLQTLEEGLKLIFSLIHWENAYVAAKVIASGEII